MDEHVQAVREGRWLWLLRLVRALRSERGGALVETAVTLPLLSLLLLGASEFGLVDYEAIEVTNAAKAGAQYGAQGSRYTGDTTGIQNAAAADAPNITLGTTTASTSLVCSDGTTPLSGPPVTCASGVAIETVLTVQTQATFNPVIHIPFVTPSFTLHGQASQRVLQ